MALGFPHLYRLAASRNGYFALLQVQNTGYFRAGLTSTAAQDVKSKESPAADHSRRKKIQIPKRIHRSPTDLLDALASTVGKDNNSPHFRYMDDPYFIPTTTSNKRIFALAKESGRKAARYIVKKYPDLFKKPVPDPQIPAFHASSQLGFERPENPTLDHLVERMRKGVLTAAFEVYQDLQKKQPGVVTPELQQELLERLCFHNGDDSVDSDLLEEKWFAYYIQKDVRRKWKVGGAAEKVFHEIQQKTPAAYSAMICGMAKFINTEGAYKMFEEMEQQQMPIPVQVYNEILRIVPLLKDSIESRWEMTMSILSQMSQQGVTPDLLTFNGVLEVISKIAAWKRSRSLSLSILAEMKKCGIEPSLASYNYLLHIFCRERGPISFILFDILREIVGKKLTLRDPRDAYFFVTAMETAGRHLQDAELAKKIYELAMQGNNSMFLTDSLKESVFYSNFFRALVAGDSAESFFKYYDDLIPMTFVPDTAMLEEIVKMLEFYDQLQHLPRIWSDAIVFGLAMKENMLETFLQTLVNNNRFELKEQFAAIALDVKTRIDSQLPNRTNRIPWTGPVISNVCTLLVRNDQLDSAWEAVLNYINKKTETLGFPSQEALGELVDALVRKKDVVKVKQCLALSVELGFSELAHRAEELARQLDLSPPEIDQWSRLYGSVKPILRPQEDENL